MLFSFRPSKMEPREEGSSRRRGKIRKMAKQIVKLRSGVTKEPPLTEEQLRRFFREHDRNGDGHLDKAELKEAFRGLGSRAPAWRAERALYYNDLDLDGLIDHEHEIEHLVSYALRFGYSLN